MTLNECVYWVGTIVVYYDTAIAWALILFYGTRSNWRMFEEGRAFLATKSVFTVVLTYLSLVTTQMRPRILVNYPQQGFVRIIVFTMVGIVFTWWLFIVLRNQRRSRKGYNDER